MRAVVRIGHLDDEISIPFIRRINNPLIMIFVPDSGGVNLCKAGSIEVNKIFKTTPFGLRDECL